MRFCLCNHFARVKLRLFTFSLHSKPLETVRIHAAEMARSASAGVTAPPMIRSPSPPQLLNQHLELLIRMHEPCT